jgi:DNA-binding CsgD family transcriptional regulator
MTAPAHPATDHHPIEQSEAVRDVEATATPLRPEPRLMSHREAQRSPDPAARMTAQSLSTVTGLVPCRLALFRSITRRNDVGDAVVLEHAPQHPATPIDPGFHRPRVRSDDPFAPDRAARLRASLLTVDDAGGAQRLANSAYGRHLHRAGFAHQLCLYLRDAGAVRGTIALLRVHGARAFDRGEIRMLRQLHPLLERAYALSLRSPAADEPASTLPALTRRELEVAALIASGATNAEIAIALGVEPSTVKTHLYQIYGKFDLRSRTQLALRLNAEGLPARLAS